MNEKEINKFIGCALLAIFASYILQMIVPFLIWGVIGAVVLRFYLARDKYK